MFQCAIIKVGSRIFGGWFLIKSTARFIKVKTNNGPHLVRMELSTKLVSLIYHIIPNLMASYTILSMTALLEYL